MLSTLRLRTGIARLLATIALVWIAVPAVAATQTASVTAKVVKPLVLTKVQDLDLGTVTLGTGV
jgi:hypothetical protein